MTNSTGTKLSPGFTWLFAILSVLVGLGLSFAVKGMGSKPMAGAYFVALVIGGFLSTYLTRSKTGVAVIAFLVTAGGAAAAYYLVIAKLFSVAAEAVPMTTTGSDAAANAATAHAVESIGNGLGIFVAIVVFFATFIPGTIGASVGSAARGKTGLAAAGAMGKSLAA